MDVRKVTSRRAYGVLLQPTTSLFPYTTLFRSVQDAAGLRRRQQHGVDHVDDAVRLMDVGNRSEEHTSELQSRRDLVCRLLLEKKKKKKSNGVRIIVHGYGTQLRNTSPSRHRRA